MKYVLNIVSFCLGFLLVFAYIFPVIEKSVLVISEEESNSEQEVFTIYTDNLTTKNFDKYFLSTDNFLAIYPKVNPLYKDRLGNIYFSCKSNCNLDDFTQYYKKILEKNNFKNDLINIDYYGVEIEKIKIYSNKEKIGEILKKCTVCRINK